MFREWGLYLEWLSLSWCRKTNEQSLDECLFSKCVLSVTRLLDYFSIFGHLHQWKFAQKYRKFADVGLKFCQILNKRIKNCRRLWIFCQSGQISSILVTLCVRLHFAVEGVPWKLVFSSSHEFPNSVTRCWSKKVAQLFPKVA